MTGDSWNDVMASLTFVSLSDGIATSLRYDGSLNNVTSSSNTEDPLNDSITSASTASIE
jgi:hypothetical protein